MKTPILCIAATLMFVLLASPVWASVIWTQKYYDTFNGKTNGATLMSTSGGNHKTTYLEVPTGNVMAWACSYPSANMNTNTWSDTIDAGTMAQNTTSNRADASFWDPINIRSGTGFAGQTTRLEAYLLGGESTGEAYIGFLNARTETTWNGTWNSTGKSAPIYAGMYATGVDDTAKWGIYKNGTLVATSTGTYVTRGGGIHIPAQIWQKVDLDFLPGATNGTGHVTLSINGTQVYDADWTGINFTNDTAVYPGFQLVQNQGNWWKNSGVDNFQVLIPEPATLALVGIGLVGLAARRRARK